MGFLESLASGLTNIAKNNYKKMTGRDYDSDLRRYRSDYEWRSDYDLRQAWEELEDDTSVYNSAKKFALLDVMKQKGISRY